jgi:hypothetical protein
MAGERTMMVIEDASGGGVLAQLGVGYRLCTLGGQGSRL